MSYRCANLAPCIVLLALLATAAAETPLGPQPAVLMLRNGELVAGDVILAGDHFDVTQPGSELHIKRCDVDFVGHNQLECYDKRRSRLEAGNVHQCLDLAEWCLRHALYEQSADALSGAVNSEPNHPRIGLLERRLKLALAHPDSSTTKPVAQPDAPSSDDLDRLVRGLPAGSVETFTTTIQPLLLNHCSNAGCHGPQSTTALRLLRIPIGRPPSRRATQRNLYSALETVDRENPQNSPLLTAALRPHGTAKAAIFTTREASQYKQLVDWVYRTASAQAPAGADQASTAPLPSPRSLERSGRKRNRPATARLPDDDTQQAASDRPGSPAPGEPESAESSASDPFDPEIFNQRYSK